MQNLFEQQAKLDVLASRHNDPKDQRAQFMLRATQFFSELATTQERLLILESLVPAAKRDIDASCGQAHSHFEATADSLGDTIINMQAALNVRYVPPEPHDSRCQCDDCVAGRSDERYDRKRDAKLEREGE